MVALVTFGITWSSSLTVTPTVPFALCATELCAVRMCARHQLAANIRTGIHGDVRLVLSVNDPEKFEKAYPAAGFASTDTTVPA